MASLVTLELRIAKLEEEADRCREENAELKRERDDDKAMINKLNARVTKLMQWKLACDKAASKWGNICLGAVGMGIVVYTLFTDSVETIKTKLAMLVKALLS